MNYRCWQFIFISFFILCSVEGHSQKESSITPQGKRSAWGVRLQTQSFAISENNLDTCNCTERDLLQKGNAGLMLSYYRNTRKRLAYSVDLGASYGRVGTLKTPTIIAPSSWLTSFNTDIYYHLGKQDQVVTPFVKTGLNLHYGSSKLYSSLPAGAGLRVSFKDVPAIITAQLSYDYGFTNDLRNNTIAALGFYVNLNKTTGKINDVLPAPEMLDSDKDNVPDLLDKCPDLMGSAQNDGCPVDDTDSDGIIDDKDNCPSIPGKKENHGCPWGDMDGDGVLDEKDRCPTKRGNKENDGCPLGDTDGDGVLDEIDVCPTLAGKKENNGCPLSDTDKDGINDEKDRCPTIPGIIANYGCPLGDKDGDGIMDEKDKCPSLSGKADNYGCPAEDTDGDGLVDVKDNCPTIPGKSQYYGCPPPDKDGDGVIDREDDCPSVAGTIQNKGCPVLNKRKDSGKGVPTGIETSTGLETPKAIVYFDLDKYNLKPEALVTIQQAVAFLSRNQDYTIVLSGHTDLRASDPYNQILSQNRVNAVRREITRLGINASRISTNFYGERNPAVDAVIETEHAKNRRVEFIFIR